MQKSAQNRKRPRDRNAPGSVITLAGRLLNSNEKQYDLALRKNFRPRRARAKKAKIFSRRKFRAIRYYDNICNAKNAAAEILSHIISVHFRQLKSNKTRYKIIPICGTSPKSYVPDP